MEYYRHGIATLHHAISISCPSYFSLSSITTLPQHCKCMTTVEHQFYIMLYSIYDADSNAGGRKSVMDVFA
eukprot:2198315-Ditylum_brightwellii.AAC.1